MISDETIQKAEQSFSNLDAWFESWNNNGGINGFVVHQHNDKMDSVIPDCMTQASCILSYLNVYKTNKNKKWLLKSKKCADYLVSIYVPQACVFSSASFEHKPMDDTLVYDAMAVFSLLRIYSFTKDKKYFLVAEDCLKNTIIKRYWDEEEDKFLAFRKGDKKLHTLNMGSMAIAAIVEYVRVTGDESYLDYARKEAAFIMMYQEKDGRLKGAYYYDDAGSWTRIMSLYISWTLMGMIEFYDYTKEKAYLESIKGACDFLYYKMLDTDTNVFYHRYMIRKYGAIQMRKGPEWIAASGASFYCLLKVSEFGLSYELDGVLSKVLDYQYPTGAFPNSRYYENMFVPHLIYNKDGTISWRDAIPIVGWNSQMFEALSLLVTKGNKSSTVTFPFNFICDDGYVFDEDEETFKISLNSEIMAVYYKKNPIVLYNRMNLADSSFCQKNMLYRSMKFKIKIHQAAILFLLYLLFIYNFLL